MEAALILLGGFVGFIIGLTGVGGGSLMTPALILLFGVTPIVAVGTDLLYAAMTKLGGVFVHHKNENIIWHIVLKMACGSVPAAFGSILLLEYLDITSTTHQALVMYLLAAALILTALFLLFREALQHISQYEQSFSLHERYRTPMTIGGGALIGVLVTFSSVGAGVIGAMFLFLLYPRLRAIQIVGTDLAHAVPITALAGIGHAHLGTVDYQLLATLVLGSLPGIFLGSHLGTRLPEQVMRTLLALLLLALGGQLLIRGS